MHVEYIRLLMDHQSIEDIPNRPDLRKTVNSRFRDGDQIAIVPDPVNRLNYHLFKVEIKVADDGEPVIIRNHVGEIQLRELIV